MPGSFSESEFFRHQVPSPIVWNLWVIFVITVSCRCPQAQSPFVVGSVPLAWSQAFSEPEQSESSNLRALLLDVARLEPRTGEIDPEMLWNKSRFEAALNAIDAEGVRFAVFHGRLEQVTPSEDPSSGSSECFVRVPDFGPVIVLASTSDLESCAISDQVLAEGWFHGVEVARARDGRERRYPVFVARLRPHVGQGLPVDTTFFFGMLCLILAVAWWLVRGRMQRSRQPRRHSGGDSSSNSPMDFNDRTPDLPSDPARALDELARRGDDSSRKAST